MATGARGKVYSQVGDLPQCGTTVLRFFYNPYRESSGRFDRAWEHSRRFIMGEVLDAHVNRVESARVLHSGTGDDGIPKLEEVTVILDHIKDVEGVNRTFVDLNVNRVWRLQRVDDGTMEDCWCTTSIDAVFVTQWVTGALLLVVWALPLTAHAQYMNRWNEFKQTIVDNITVDKIKRDVSSRVNAVFNARGKALKDALGLLTNASASEEDAGDDWNRRFTRHHD